MQKTCENCYNPFNAKRKTAKFCSDSCRKAAARKAGADPVTGEVLETIPAKDVQLSPERQESKLKADKLGITLAEYERRMSAFVKMGMPKVDWISTGIEEFDDLTKIPRGRITQIQGPYGVGKTTLCLNMIAGMKGVKVLYIDSEAALNPELLVNLGIDDRNFTLYNDSAFLEDIAEVIREAASSGKYDVVIFDSLAAVTTHDIDEGKFTASNIGQKAKLMHKLISLTQMDFKNTNTAFVVINQEREVLGGYVPQKYTPGGMAVPYAASLMVSLKTIKSWRFPDKPKDNIYKGHVVEATIIKSKVNNPWRVKKFKLNYPQPVMQAEEVKPNVVPAF